MYKRLLIVISLISVTNTYSQEKYEKLPFAEKVCPTYIFNKNIIGSNKIIKDCENLNDLKKQVKNIFVLKDKPTKEDDYYNLSSQGILLVDLKNNFKLESKKQSELNRFFGLKLDNSIYIDGYLITSKKYKIATKSISALELIIPTNENGLESSVLNIWTLSKEERKYNAENGCSMSKHSQ